MTSVETLLTVGEQRRRAGDHDAAIHAANKTLHAQPHCIDAYLLRGKAFDGMGCVESAARDSRIVLRLEPEHTEARTLLESANERRRARTRRLRKRDVVLGFPVIKFLGSGWEGATYLVRDARGSKRVVKAFFEHRVRHLNSRILGIHRKPVPGGQSALVQLSERSRSHPSETVYPVTLLRKGTDIVGVTYDYDRLIPIRSRYFGYRGFRLSVLGAFLRTQAYMLRSVDVVVVDASLSNFMMSTTGKFKFVDYGDSISPLNDFRCEEDHWEVLVLINVLCQLFKPSQAFRLGPHDLGTVGSVETGLRELGFSYPFVSGLLNRIEAADYGCFVDPSFYDHIARGLPRGLAPGTVVRINAHDTVARLRRKLVGRA